MPQSSLQPCPEYTESKIGLLDWLLGRKARILAEAQDNHAAAIANWEQTERQRADDHATAVGHRKARETAFWAEHEAARGLPWKN